VEALDLANGRPLWQRPLAADHGSIVAHSESYNN
jgi:hypothetical protein